MEDSEDEEEEEGGTYSDDEGIEKDHEDAKGTYLPIYPRPIL